MSSLHVPHLLSTYGKQTCFYFTTCVMAELKVYLFGVLRYCVLKLMCCFHCLDTTNSVLNCLYRCATWIHIRQRSHTKQNTALCWPTGSCLDLTVSRLSCTPPSCRVTPSSVKPESRIKTNLQLLMDLLRGGAVYVFTCVCDCASICNSLKDDFACTQQLKKSAFNKLTIFNSTECTHLKKVTWTVI